MTLSIDTDAALECAARWSEAGHRLATVQGRMESLTEALEFRAEQAPSVLLATAASSLWTGATIVSGAVEAVVAGEVFDAPAAMPRACGWYSPIGGDLGGTFDAELRAPYLSTAATAAQLGLSVMVRALADSAMATQIHQDEFEIVQFGSATVVVLPGVIDLTNFGSGLSKKNRSVRDLDETAAPAYLGFENKYATAVAEALAHAGVPQGSDVVLIGHSAGGQAALNLAADRDFNGPNGFNVTHVVSAGYDAFPLLDDVPDHTNALVLENFSDVPVLGERFGRKLVDELVPSPNDFTPDRLLRSALLPVVGSALVNTLWPSGDGPDDSGGNRLGIRFSGGSDGAGHAQSNYIEELETASPALAAFGASVGAVVAPPPPGPEATVRRRRATGTALAIDVSVPQES